MHWLSGPGSRFIVLGVALLLLSASVILWSATSEWRYQAQRPAAPPTESLPERLTPPTPRVRTSPAIP